MLTKEADKLLTAAYKQYQSRRKDGTSRDTAAEFSNGYFNKVEPFSSWPYGDIPSAIHELSSAKLVHENILGDVTINTETIAMLESKNVEQLKKFFDVSSEIVKLVTGFASVLR